MDLIDFEPKRFNYSPNPPSKPFKLGVGVVIIIAALVWTAALVWFIWFIFMAIKHKRWKRLSQTADEGPEEGPETAKEGGREFELQEFSAPAPQEESAE